MPCSAERRRSTSYLNGVQAALLFDRKSVSYTHLDVYKRQTMHYIEKYLKFGSRILEIGAGTGRYSHALACLLYTSRCV